MTQKEFYKSQQWRRARESYIQYRIRIDGGICEKCHVELGKIVHHTVWLDDVKCNDPDIALNFKYFRYECQTCHNKEKDPERMTTGRTRFSFDGTVIIDD